MTRWVVIELTDHEIASLDQERGELSRSAFVRQLLREHMQRLQDEADVSAFVESYRQFPETEADRALALQLAARLTADDPLWED